MAEPRAQSLRAKVFVGLLLALIAPVCFRLAVGERGLGAQLAPTATVLAGLAAMWGLAIGVIILVKRVEQRPLASIGWTRPSRTAVFQALGAGVALSLAVPLLSILASSLIPTQTSGSIANATQIPRWLMLLSVFTAGVTEEILFRGYALERLLEWSGSKWLSSIIALVFFALTHVGGWSLAHIVGVVIPMGAALIALYWWRRNLMLVMIVHVTVNLPLIVMASGSP
jgi:uncharacterized protein